MDQMDEMELGAQRDDGEQGPGGCDALAAAISRACAGTHVLKFKVCAALEAGAFTDGDEDDGCMDVARCTIEDAKAELMAAGAILVGIGSGPVASMAQAAALSPVSDGAVPSDDLDVVDLLSDGHDVIADAWTAAAEEAQRCGKADVAEFCAARAQAHSDMADAADDYCEDEDGDDDSDGAPDDGGYMDEAASLELGMLDEASKPRPKGAKRKIVRGGKKGVKLVAGTPEAMKVGRRSAAEISADIARQRHGKDGSPLKIAGHLVAAGRAVGKKPQKARLRARHIANLSRAELKAKMADIAARG